MVKGVPHFLKVGFTKSVGISKLTKESMGLAKSVGQDECKSLEEKFEQYKTSIDLAWTSNWGGTKGSAGVGSSGDKKAVILAKDRAQEALGKLQELSTVKKATPQSAVATMETQIEHIKNGKRFL
ncbi:unnamed protein product [Durusdinium trenchii]|uniref:Uncharacterized protein n=1 Tax=Durusdinium trenchii TaxID=1381693 RepID=A0ABP0R6Z8_9DINO